MTRLNTPQRPRGGDTAFGVYTGRLMARKRREGRDNAADLYRTVRNWLIYFNGGKDFPLARITAAMVYAFASMLRERGLKTNTINTYLSNVRAIYNEARREGLIPKGTPNPFEGLSLRRELPGSRALDGKTMERIAALDPEEPELCQARDLCVFSFLACGMPFADLARLTDENLQGDELVYKRRKTGTLIRVRLTPGMRRILKKYARPGFRHLFPILPDGGCGHERYKSLLHYYNRNLRELGKMLPQPIPLTSYVFRHTWATEALRKHTPVSVISQALGHTSEKTTRFYLASLEQPELDRANRVVTERVDRIVARAG